MTIIISHMINRDQVLSEPHLISHVNFSAKITFDLQNAICIRCKQHIHCFQSKDT